MFLFFYFTESKSYFYNALQIRHNKFESKEIILIDNLNQCIFASSKGWPPGHNLQETVQKKNMDSVW